MFTAIGAKPSGAGMCTEMSPAVLTIQNERDIHERSLFLFALQMFRLTIRSSKETVTNEIAELLIDQF